MNEHKPNWLHCKDIPTAPILRFLLENAPDPYFLFEGLRSIKAAFPQGFDTPDNLCRAKMRKLIERKLVDGCACGCRGDFRITEYGRTILFDLEFINELMEKGVESKGNEHLVLAESF